ncbi:MAG: hypothetical protein N2Z72_07900 [Bacteroidales bacterium]|nr:hypothetical protein [Bacteroidales bacterium]
MKNSFIFSIGFVLFTTVFLTSCTEEELAITNDNWGKLTLFIYPNSGPSEEWYFSTVGSSGFASLKGVDDYPFVYQYIDADESILTFNIGTSIKYEMTWTANLKGNFVKYENNVNKGSGTFSIDKD